MSTKQTPVQTDNANRLNERPLTPNEVKQLEAWAKHQEDLKVRKIKGMARRQSKTILVNRHKDEYNTIFNAKLKEIEEGIAKGTITLKDSLDSDE